MSAVSGSRLIFLVLVVATLAAALVLLATLSSPVAAAPFVQSQSTAAVLTAEPFLTPTPGPEPTATPEPRSQPDEAQAAALVAEGQEAFLESDLEGAESAFIEAIAADPRHLPAHLALAHLYLYQPHYWQQGLAAVEAARELAPDDPAVLAHLALAQRAAYRVDEARETAERAVELAPDSALAHAALADVLLVVYEGEAALEHAQLATDLDPELAMGWANLAAAEYNAHNWDEATAAISQTVTLEPAFFAWHLNRARYYLGTTGDTEGARDIARPAIRALPRHPWVLEFQADLAAEEREWSAAEAACEGMIAYDQPHTPYPDAYTCMATMLILQERFAEAEQYQAVAEERAWPDRFDVSLLRMRLLMDREQCREARDLARVWLQERPYSLLAMRMMAATHQCDDEPDGAIAFLEDAYAAMPRSVDIARDLAVAYAEADRASDAMAILNEIRPFARDDPAYYQARYEVQATLGNFREALLAAQRWQVMRPDSTEPRLRIALMHLLLDEPGAALGAAQSAQESGEDSSMLYTVLGQVHLQQGNAEQAEENLQQAVDRNANNALAREFLASLYLAGGRCEQALDHLAWLEDHERDDERRQQFGRAIEICEASLQPQEPPDPETALDDEEAVAEAERIVEAAGAEVGSIEFSDEISERALIVIYVTRQRPASRGFLEQEQELGMELARMMPRLVDRPSVIALIPTSPDGTNYGITLIPVAQAVLWAQGTLTDEEFLNTWQQLQA